MKNIGMAFVAAVALVAGSAQAQEAGWDTKYGVLFTLPNPLDGHVAGDHSLISGYNGIVGVQYNLAPQTALRFSLNLSRTSEGPTEITNAAGVKTQTIPASTSAYDVKLAGEYLMRMSTAAVAPYAGVGAFVTFNQDNRSGDDTASGVKYDEWTRTMGVGLLGKLGVEWRVHKVISIFAEYEADLTIAQGTNGEINDTNIATGAVVLKGKTSEGHYLNLGEGVSQGGRLGIAAFF